MAVFKLADVINNIKNDAKVESIYGQLTKNALDNSAVARLRGYDKLTVPSQVGMFPGRMAAHFAAENATKSKTDVTPTNWNYQVQAMYIIVPVSKLVYTSQQDAMDAIMAELELGIGEGLDREILRGVDGVMPTYVTMSGVANTASTSDFYADVSNVLGQVEGNGYTVSGIVARSSERAAFRNSRADGATGVPLFSADGSQQYAFGTPIEYVRAGDNNAPLRSGNTANTVRLVAGDWQRGLALGVYGVTDIEINPYGTGWTTNQVEIRAELYVGFAVKDVNAFSYLKQS